MRYLPHTDEDIVAMLATVGVADLDSLFGSIPADCRMEGELRLPAALSEWELDDHMDRLAGSVAVAPEYRIFLGAGSYDHHIPAVVSSLIGRSEFLTSYTPYQPEMLQGTLQGIYEYQTLTARLLGMEVATASLIDVSNSSVLRLEAYVIRARIKRGMISVTMKGKQ